METLGKEEVAGETGRIGSGNINSAYSVNKEALARGCLSGSSPLAWRGSQYRPYLALKCLLERFLRPMGFLMMYPLPGIYLSANPQDATTCARIL